MRGRFARLFDRQELFSVGWHWPVTHINLSDTIRAGTVRGLHYQVPPSAEAKFVTCVRGEIWDVAVDIRSGSPTFLQWCARKLSEEGLNSMLIPPGFAHGFQAMCDNVTVVYIHSSEYSPADERGIGATDDRLGIKWPMPVSHRSARDLSFPRLDAYFAGVTI
jgi:dTDP-4-dehydrorhamnose 3,5-epimerase